ncbi:hypothetical protein N7475_008810 [Penicillium sp. IBT 31633x]|nr:hypothetical protein N7475_008810 [Penicillium sp. IBT 31633x]
MAINDIFSIITFTKHPSPNHNRDPIHQVGSGLQELPEEQDVKMQRLWISQHHREIKRANNIVQREMHIGARLFHYQTLAESESPPDASALKKLRECEIELKYLRLEYLQHLEMNTELTKHQPPGRLVERFTRSLRHKPKQFWNIEHAYCQFPGLMLV